MEDIPRVFVRQFWLSRELVFRSNSIYIFFR
jgi:hypothetical protein